MVLLHHHSARGEGPLAAECGTAMGEAKRRRENEDERRKEAERILERVSRDSETIGSSGFARTTNRLASHFLAKDSPQDDPIEVLGKRIGRLLSLIAFVGLAIYLFLTYVVK